MTYEFIYLSHLINIKGDNPIKMTVWKKKQLGVGLPSDIHKQISFKLGMIMEATELSILILLRIMSILIQDQS